MEWIKKLVARITSHGSHAQLGLDAPKRTGGQDGHLVKNEAAVIPNIDIPLKAREEGPGIKVGSREFFCRYALRDVIHALADTRDSANDPRIVLANALMSCGIRIQFTKFPDADGVLPYRLNEARELAKDTRLSADVAGEILNAIDNLNIMKIDQIAEGLATDYIRGENYYLPHTIVDIKEPSQPWRDHAYPLQQITIRLQGTKHSDRTNIISLLETVLARLRAGDMEGQDHDDDFGYLFKIETESTGPSFFVEPAGAS